MIEIAVVLVSLIAIYLYRSDKSIKSKREHKKKPSEPDYGPSYFCPMTTEIKSLYSRGASCSIYRDGTVEAFGFHYGKGGCAITQDEFNSLDFHATRGGVWKKEVNNIDGTLSEEINLMPTLNLPSPASPPDGPAQVPRRDYGFSVY
jgi:hypothetical protein